MTELAFVMAPGRNLFFAELVEALRDELRRLGVASSVHEGRFPVPRPDLVYALVPPHEYFVLSQGQPAVPKAALARTIAICAEQPGTRHFDDNARLLKSVGAAFDINRHAIAAYRRHGLAVDHLQLGYTPRWDRRLRPQDPRDIDVLFMGCETKRRRDALASYTDVLSPRRNVFLLSDNSRPNFEASPSFMADREKLDLLARSRVLLNIHQGEEPYFEWLRAIQAIACGCVIVSEHSLELAPLIPGEHLLVGGIESLGWIADRLLEEEGLRASLEQQAYELLRSELPLATGAERLAGQAEALVRRRTPEPDAPYFTGVGPKPPPFIPPGFEPPATEALQASAPVRRALKDLILRVTALSRQVDGLEHRLERPEEAAVQVVDETPAHACASRRVSVLLTLFNYEDHIETALDSVAASTYRDWEVVVVDDSSTDGSAKRVQGWMRSHPGAPVLLVRHTSNRGLPSARNTALAFSRGELCFVLDADNQVLPGCLGQLVGALDSEPDAAFAYGMLQRFHAGGSLGLMNYWPWEPPRLRAGNYIDAMALIRRRELERYGGWSTDPRLHGWEDYELWCRMAEDEQRAAFVRDVVARYRATGHSMISFSNLSVTDAFSIIIERCPRLMAGIAPPP